MKLSNKKIIALGERDGVPATAIGACARSAGAEVILELTHCFI
jgi:betaine reductase